MNMSDVCVNCYNLTLFHWFNLFL